MTQNPRDSIIAKIQKLSAMTIAAGATENEAAMAAAAIERLMREYNVTLDETQVRVQAKGCIDLKWTEIIRSKAEGSHVLNVGMQISELTSTRCWQTLASEDLFDTGDYVLTVTTHFFGLPTDAAAAVAMAEIISGAIGNEYQSWKKANKRRHGTNLFDSFRRGISSRLCQRLRDLGDIPQEKGLVVLKEDLVNEQFAALGLHLRRAVSTRANDQSAFSGGYARGDRVDLGHGRKVGGLTPRKIGAG